MTELKFKVLRKITYQQIKLETGITYYLRVDSAIYLGKGDTRPKVAGDEKPQDPPHLINVTDCETGEIGVIVAPAILVSELNDAFPDGDYEGHGFAITILGKKAGKRYNTVELTEIELPEHLRPAAPEHGFDWGNDPVEEPNPDAADETEPTVKPSHGRRSKASS